MREAPRLWSEIKEACRFNAIGFLPYPYRFLRSNNDVQRRSFRCLVFLSYDDAA
jgi:hypothetical protein